MKAPGRQSSASSDPSQKCNRAGAAAVVNPSTRFHRAATVHMITLDRAPSSPSSLHCSRHPRFGLLAPLVFLHPLYNSAFERQRKYNSNSFNSSLRRRTAKPAWLSIELAMLRLFPSSRSTVDCMLVRYLGSKRSDLA